MTGDAKDLHEGVAGLDGALHARLGQLVGEEHRRPGADRRLGGARRAPRVVGVADGDRREVVALAAEPVVLRDRGECEGVGARGRARRPGRDLEGVDLVPPGLQVGVVPRAAAAERRGAGHVGREDRRVVDLREAARGAHRVEDLAGRARRAQGRERSVGLAAQQRAGAVVHAGGRRLGVRVPAGGDDLRAADDELAGVRGLVAADLGPGAAADVVRERHEVQPRAALLHRAERVAEDLAHRGVPQGGLLGVDVQVARVPAPARGRRARVVGRRGVGLVGVGRIGQRPDLQAPGHAAVGVPVGGADDRRDTQLGRPLAGGDRTGQEAARRAAGHVALRPGEVLGLGGEPLRRHRDVRMARAAPPAERAGGVVEAEVERVLEDRAPGRLGLVEAVLHAHRGRALGDVEGHQDVAALLLGAEVAGDDLRGGDRIARAALRHGRRHAPGQRERGEGEGGVERGPATHARERSAPHAGR